MFRTIHSLFLVSYIYPVRQVFGEADGIISVSLVSPDEVGSSSSLSAMSTSVATAFLTSTTSPEPNTEIDITSTNLATATVSSFEPFSQATSSMNTTASTRLLPSSSTNQTFSDEEDLADLQRRCLSPSNCSWQLAVALSFSMSLIAYLLVRYRRRLKAAIFASLERRLTRWAGLDQPAPHMTESYWSDWSAEIAEPEPQRRVRFEDSESERAEVVAEIEAGQRTSFEDTEPGQVEMIVGPETGQRLRFEESGSERVEVVVETEIRMRQLPEDVQRVVDRIAEVQSQDLRLPPDVYGTLTRKPIRADSDSD